MGSFHAYIRVSFTVTCCTIYHTNTVRKIFPILQQFDALRQTWEMCSRKLKQSNGEWIIHTFLRAELNTRLFSIWQRQHFWLVGQECVWLSTEGKGMRFIQSIDQQSYRFSYHQRVLCFSIPPQKKRKLNFLIEFYDRHVYIMKHSWFSELI